MKITVDENQGIIHSISLSVKPSELLILNAALIAFSCNENRNSFDRKKAQQMYTKIIKELK